MPGGPRREAPSRRDRQCCQGDADRATGEEIEELETDRARGGSRIRRARWEGAGCSDDGCAGKRDCSAGRRKAMVYVGLAIYTGNLSIDCQGLAS
jgi:hypothetical protein